MSMRQNAVAVASGLVFGVVIAFNLPAFAPPDHALGSNVDPGRAFDQEARKSADAHARPHRESRRELDSLKHRERQPDSGNSDRADRGLVPNNTGFEAPTRW